MPMSQSTTFPPTQLYSFLSHLFNIRKDNTLEIEKQQLKKKSFTQYAIFSIQNIFSQNQHFLCFCLHNYNHFQCKALHYDNSTKHKSLCSISLVISDDEENRKDLRLQLLGLVLVSSKNDQVLSNCFYLGHYTLYFVFLLPTEPPGL